MELLARDDTAAGRLHYCDSVSAPVPDFMREIFWAMVATLAALCISSQLSTNPDFLNQTGYFTPPTGTDFQNQPSLCRLKPLGIPERYLRALGIYVVQRTRSGISRMSIPRSHGTHGTPWRSTRPRPDSRYARVFADMESAVMMQSDPKPWMIEVSHPLGSTEILHGRKMRRSTRPTGMM